VYCTFVVKEIVENWQGRSSESEGEGEDEDTSNSFSGSGSGTDNVDGNKDGPSGVIPMQQKTQDSFQVAEGFCKRELDDQLRVQFARLSKNFKV
jgi:hypothetical protein